MISTLNTRTRTTWCNIAKGCTASFVIEAKGVTTQGIVFEDDDCF